jgi:glutaredoxin 3
MMGALAGEHTAAGGGPVEDACSPEMAAIEIFTTPLCPYCWRAKRLLEKKRVTFIEIDLWQEPGRRAEMVERAGGRATVPQLFIDGRAIGGSDELLALEAAGELDGLLGRT